MSEHQVSTELSGPVWMPANTSRRAGFGTSFARRTAVFKGDGTVMSVSLSAPGTRQDGTSSFGKPFEHQSTREPTATTLTPLSSAPSLGSSIPASNDSSPSATSSSGPTNEQQLLSQQMMQLSGNMATCVHQNELVISLLERLVAISESMASTHKPASDSRAIASPALPPRARVASGSNSHSETASKADHSYVLHHMVDKVITAQQHSSNMPSPSQRGPSLSNLYNESVNFCSSPGESVVLQHAGKSEGLLSYSRYRTTAPTNTSGNSVQSIAPGSVPAQCDFAEFPTFSAAIVANEQVENAPPMCYDTMGDAPASLFVTDDGQQRHMTRRTSLRISTLPQRDGSDITTFTRIDSMQHVSDDRQQPKKRKRAEIEDAAASDKSSQLADSNSRDKDVGPWQDWVVPRQPSSSVLEGLPAAKHRTLREVRAEIKASSSRPSGAVGRIPLKQYLEVSGPDECRAVRRLGRALYTAWLEPNTRLGKQDNARLSACVNCIEYTFPILADCEEHWKARQVMLQVIDNAIDEHKSSERRSTTMSSALANDAPSRKRGRPKGTTAAAMAQRRQEQQNRHSCEQDDHSNETDGDDHSDLSDSETEA